MIKEQFYELVFLMNGFCIFVILFLLSLGFKSHNLVIIALAIPVVASNLWMAIGAYTGLMAKVVNLVWGEK